ncbi:TIGR04283 family arsenosugar biosynthesis glycosyltransferase [Algoriphagus sp.]|uniref:TIGR04283 family arsenosugar biosynthesis glycosyltransferase n=1 Tax=Algoriphagus sp. TaxID=1872435 RepID=UPI0025FAFE80|nr:TIGR04283 family arsenosugar biosynthesis glycosyltransferase [Algoriphagus sp.]
MTRKETISVIIPTYNEAKNLKGLIPKIFDYGGEFVYEVIVVDGGSSDETVEIAKSLGAKVIQTQKRSRAHQLNVGFKISKSVILYFIHADTRPVPSFSADILDYYFQGKEAACYRYAFDKDSFLLKINSFFTRFNGIFAGGGDQTLYITRNLLDRLKGFDEKYVIMEDFDLAKRIRKVSKLYVFPREIKVSARKYESNGWLRVQIANIIAFLLFSINSKPESIKSLYCNLLNQPKNSN